MAVKKATAAKKLPAKKAVKKTTTRKYNKGDNLVCEVCGLSVVVDTACDCGEEAVLICCEQPMKQRKARTSKAKVAARELPAGLNAAILRRILHICVYLI